MTKFSPCSPPHLRTAGFTLLEVLIAMLLLAIGLLGVAAMQLRGLQYNHDAYLRSQISILAYDMADRMRLNEANAASYVLASYTVPTTAPSGCAVATIGAAMDLTCWKTQLYEALPPGSTASIVAGTGDEYTVSLGWADREEGVGSSNRIVQYTFMP